MLEGVTISESKAQKDEILLQGNDLQNVSQSAASIHGACLVKNKGMSSVPLNLSPCYPKLPARCAGEVIVDALMSFFNRYPKVPRRYLRLGEDHRRPGGLELFAPFMDGSTLWQERGCSLRDHALFDEIFPSRCVPEIETERRRYIEQG